MPASLKSVVWWVVAILVFLWVFKTPGASQNVASVFGSLMSAILAVVTDILRALSGIIPGA
jgi:uncharacterized protein YggT (Ycf19 family)